MSKVRSWREFSEALGIAFQLVRVGVWVLASGAIAVAQTTATTTNSTTTTKPKPVTQADTIVVQDTAVTSEEVAVQELNSVAGGTSLIDTETLNKGRVANVADALKFQPGVWAQSQTGGEATRLSIRGSGITRGANLFGWGTQVLIDGLPQWSSSGYPYEHIDPVVTSRIDVLRGGNGFNYGPLSLGGVVNYVTKTGYDASPAELRVEAGSYGYFKEVASSGLVEGPADYYLAVDHMDWDGYRTNSGGTSSRVVTNVGYKINDDISTRFNFRYSQQYQDDPGTLTWNQLENDPKQANPNYRGQVLTRANPGSYMASNITKIQIDPDSAIETGFQYNNYPINGIGGDNQTNFDFDDVSASLRYTRDDYIFGDHQSKTLLAYYQYEQLNATFDSFDRNWSQTGRRPSSLSDRVWVAQNQTEVAKNWWLETGSSVAWQYRWTQIEYSTATTDRSAVSAEYLNFLPRLGVRYEYAQDQQVFANVTRSVDAPSSNSFIRTNGAAGIPLATVDLKAQDATTAEIGTRGKSGIFQWELSLYHSWISNELLNVNVTPGAASPTVIASNASPTHHQGIEAGLNTTLWEDKSSKKPESSDPKAVLEEPAKTQPTRVVFQQVYTLNNFYFDNDPNFGRNTLPGVPVHFYQAAINFEHESGFYFGVNTEASLAPYFVDYQNTITAKQYAIFGSRIGWQQPGKGWEVFVEFKNLLDEVYASQVAPVYKANGVDQSAYYPGVGRTVTGGVSYKF